jgi:hypothetical protein
MYRQTNCTKIDVRIFPAWNLGIDAYKPHLNLELTPLDEVSADIHAELDVFKGELKRADVKDLHDFLARLEI